MKKLTIVIILITATIMVLTIRDIVLHCNITHIRTVKSINSLLNNNKESKMNDRKKVYNEIRNHLRYLTEPEALASYDNPSSDYDNLLEIEKILHHAVVLASLLK